MIFIEPSDTADFRMRIFNADGSEAQMCGNGIRCVGKYVYDKGYTDRTDLLIETRAGLRSLKLELQDGRVRAATVQMGRAVTGEEAEITAAGRMVKYLPVDVGNPHAVVFVHDAERVPLEELGPAMEHHEAFPGGVNAEFVQVLSDRELRMRVWERGSGITMACGTRACASTAAAVKKGFCQPEQPILVHLDGGTLEILVHGDGSVVMTGPARTVYEGEAE